MKLYKHQVNKADEGIKVLREKLILYLAMEVRTGKTLTSLEVARQYGAKNVLFLTKKKAIDGIRGDYDNFGYSSSFDITIINNESAHLVTGDFDLIISDEHHRNAAFPKPNTVTKLIKKNYSKLPMIFLSGTPHAESYSQIFHQFWLSDYTPFLANNFYSWFKKYGLLKVKEPKSTGYPTNNYKQNEEDIRKYCKSQELPGELAQKFETMLLDYNAAKINEIISIIRPYIVTCTQKEAGFETKVTENVIKVKMLPITYKIAERLQRDKVVVSSNGGIILADTAVKEMQKLHQIYSGSVILEGEENSIFDYSKAEKIKEMFEGKKIGIFYKFKAEYFALKKIFGDNLTSDLDEFNETNKNIALQIVSGSEGISLKKADALCYYNIDFSSTKYWQSRDRLTTKDRLENSVYWFFAKNGIEEKIYEQVLQKKSYTLSVFNKDFVF